MASGPGTSAAPRRAPSSGATPRLSAVRLNSNERMPPISLFALEAPQVHSPVGKSPRPAEEMLGSSSGGTPKVARHGADGDAASASRDPSRHASIDSSSNNPALALLLPTGEEGEGSDEGGGGGMAPSTQQIQSLCAHNQ